MTDSATTQAHEVSLRLLSVRARSTHEIETALVRRGYSPEVIGAMLSRLQACGLIDDEQFARTWVQSRAQVRGLARRRLRHELTNKGVDMRTADEALADVTPDDEVDAAGRLVRQRLGRLSGPPDDAQIRRVAALLSRRGFSEW